MADLNNLVFLSFLSIILVISTYPRTISADIFYVNGEDSAFSPPLPVVPVPPASSPSIQITPRPHITSPPSPSPASPFPTPANSPLPLGPSPSDNINNDNDSPAPSPSDASDIKHVVSSDTSTEEPNSSSSNGLNGLQKMGIIVGVVLVAGVVIVGGFVYKKRQDNIRRSRYAYAAGGNVL